MDPEMHDLIADPISEWKLKIICFKNCKILVRLFVKFGKLHVLQETCAWNAYLEL